MSGANPEANDAAPLAAIFGCAGLTLSDDERAFFAATDPLGFILFARNCHAPEQIMDLVAALRGTVNRPEAPVLIDQEGGRVVRLPDDVWRHPPAAPVFGALHRRDPEAARRACWINARLIAHDLHALGIDVNCLPVLDLAQPGTTAIIAERAYGPETQAAADLGRAACEGSIAGGVLPVIKHIPGHGGARADSHLELPTVESAADALESHDFSPFRALADMPLAMTAHVVYTAIDPARPATQSPEMVSRCIRQAIGFDGLLMTDDLSMHALDGGFEARAAASLAAGCDVVLHCNGNAEEMRAVAGGARSMDAGALARWRRAAELRQPPADIDAPALLAELDSEMKR